MKNHIVIRLEEKSEYREVENLVRDSFWNVYRPGCLEHYVLNQLRNDPAFVPELDYSLEKAAELGCGALCFEGNIDFYEKSGFRQASEYGIRYHGLPEGGRCILLPVQGADTGISGWYYRRVCNTGRVSGGCAGSGSI